MSIQMQLRAVTGVFVLLSVALAHFHSPNWVFFTIFIGISLLQSSFTNFCPMEILLKKINQTKAQG